MYSDKIQAIHCEYNIDRTVILLSIIKLLINVVYKLGFN